MTARLIGIPATQAAAFWPGVLPLIERAVSTANGRYQAEDIFKAIIERDMQLWVVAVGETMKAALVTQIIVYPRIKACRLVCVTGDDRQDWQHLIVELEGWAQQQGCKLGESIAREGWTKIMAKVGYVKSHVFLEKDLS